MPRPHLLCLAAALMTLMSAACASPSPEKSASFDVASGVPAPRLSMIWRTAVSGRESFAFRPQEYSTPVFVPRTDDLVLGTSDGNVTRMRAGNGAVVWQHKLISSREGGKLAIHADPVVAQNIIYVATINGSVFALDYNDGTQLWEYRAEDAVESAVVHDDEGRLFFSDAREILYALDAQTGKLLWRFQRPTPEFFTIKGSGTPMIDGDAVYCGFADGTLAAVQIDSGELIWSADLSNEEVEFVDIDMPVIIGERELYVGSYAGGVFAVSRLDGSIQWRADVGSVSRVSLYGGVLYVASALGRVMAIDTFTHKPIWSFRMQKDIPVELTPYGDYVFASTSSGPLYVLDRFTGKPLLKWNPSTGFNSPVVFDGHRGFVLSNGGYVYGFDLTF